MLNTILKLRILLCASIIFTLFSSILIAQEVILFSLEKYKGRSVTLTGNHPILALDNTVESIKLKRGVKQVALFEHQNYGGRCMILKTNKRSLSNTLLGNNTISSIKVNGYCPVTRPSVLLYEHENYSGKRVEVTQDEKSLASLNFLNKTSSIQLVNTQSAALYDKKNFEGDCQTFKQNAPNMNGSMVRDNRASSIRFNKTCDDYKKLTFVNNSTTIIAVSIPDAPTRVDLKEIWGGSRFSIVLGIGFK